MSAGRDWLIAGGASSAAASVAHLGCIAGGPSWYRAFGAGEWMARAVERGQATPHLVTLGIAALLAVWSAYAFAGAGLLRPLPLLRWALAAIAAAYLVRGMVLFFPGALQRPDLSPGFLFWSSLIVLAIGLIHLIGLALAWPRLSGVAP